MSERPTGIIRTLPNLYAGNNKVAHDRMLASYQALAAGTIPAIYIALDQKPKIEVLHMYILIQAALHWFRQQSEASGAKQFGSRLPAFAFGTEFTVQDADREAMIFD